MTFLLGLLAAKGLGALVGGIILLATPAPRFDAPVLVQRSDTLYLETTLRHAFNRELDQFLASGSNIAVAYTVTLHRSDARGNEDVSDPFSFFHSALYDPIEGHYRVYQSELHDTRDSLGTVATLADARAGLTHLVVPLVVLNKSTADVRFAARIEAALNTIRLEAMDNRELDLNTFWNYRYPRARTPWMEPRP